MSQSISRPEVAATLKEILSGRQTALVKARELQAPAGYEMNFGPNGRVRGKLAQAQAVLYADVGGLLSEVSRSALDRAVSTFLAECRLVVPGLSGASGTTRRGSRTVGTGSRFEAHDRRETQRDLENKNREKLRRRKAEHESLKRLRQGKG